MKAPDEVTNVVKFAQSVIPVASDGTRQVVYYNSGVGTGGPIDRLLGGVLGAGVRSNVHRAYTFLTLNYEPGDEIYILGFSRGAFTGRALAALIGVIGVLRRQEFERFDEAWKYYRLPPKRRPGKRAGPRPAEGGQAGKPSHTAPEAAWFHHPVAVKALGVWDTVGSYGISSGLFISGWGAAITAKLLGFHDRQLGAHVEHAYHAIAIDEARGPFQPTLWLQPKGTKRANVEQVWFAGVHSDVGGGFSASGLSDTALVWMMDRMSVSGLELDPDFIGQEYCPCPGCELHNSGNLLFRLLSPYPRPVLSGRPPIEEGGTPQEVISEKLHWSVVERWTAARAAGADKANWLPKNLPKDLTGVPVSEPGQFELEILRSARPHPRHAPPPRHEGCWSQAVPQRFGTGHSSANLATAGAAERGAN
ncbi:DUF2235 domain-containing protein [Enterovirga sp. CN4-39]|uniref:DUF2235 domain-containing protein n=1 Tax=Enterovirga sp. CN4-39 TaxID=3400910 RepID=UPI003C1086ED